MFLTAWQLQRVDEILSRSAQSYTGFCLTVGARCKGCINAMHCSSELSIEHAILPQIGYYAHAAH